MSRETVDDADPPVIGAPAAAGWTASTFLAFREPAYRAFWLNTFLAGLAIVMALTTETIVAFDLTGNNRSVGALTFALGIPMLVLTPIAGALADRLSKLFLIFLSEAMLAGVTLYIALLLSTGLISFPLLLLGAFLTGASLSLVGPAQIAYMGQIVGQGALGNATALFSVALALTRVAGPFIVAGLVSWDAAGTAGSLYVVTVAAVLAVALLIALPPSRGTPRLPTGQSGAASVLADIRLGVRHVAENRRLLQLVVGFFAITLIGFSYFVVLPRFASDVLGGGTAGFAIMAGVSSVGGLLASLGVASLADSKRAEAYLTLSSLGFGVALAVTALSPTYAVALALMFLVGAAASAFQTLNNAVAFREASPAYLGRIVALMNVAWSLTNLVGLPVGLAADQASERATLAAVGLALCAVTAALALWTRAPRPAGDSDR